MRYWAYFAAKAGSCRSWLYGLLSWFRATVLRRRNGSPTHPSATAYDFLLCDLALMLWFLLCAGALLPDRLGPALPLPRLPAPPAHADRDRLLEPHAAIRPAAHRIHLPLRPRNPERGRIADLRPDANPEWTPHSDDIWEELCAPGKDTGDGREPAFPAGASPPLSRSWPRLLCFGALFAPIYVAISNSRLTWQKLHSVWTTRLNPTTPCARTC